MYDSYVVAVLCYTIHFSMLDFVHLISCMASHVCDVAGNLFVTMPGDVNKCKKSFVA